MRPLIINGRNTKCDFARWVAAFWIFLVLCAMAYGQQLPNPNVRCPVTGPASAPGIVSITLRDATTSQGVVGALVEWNFSGHAMTGSTDDEGRFAFRLPVADQQNGQQVKLSIERNGYASETTSVRVCPGTNPPLTLSLTPVTNFGTVEGQVVNPATGEGVPNATVGILIERFPQVGLTATTGSDGKYAIHNVGFGTGITLQVTTASPPCVAPTTREIDVRQATVTENFSLPMVTTGQLRCPPVFSGPEPGPDIRHAGSIGDPHLLDDSSIQWHIATNNAILNNDVINAWNSGHINDILKLGPNQALVASQTAGVWSVAWSNNTSFALPLSTSWGSIGMTSLAQGPDGTDHVYAGTSDDGPGSPGGVLWETDTSLGAPLLGWAPDSPKPQCGTIEHVLVIKEFRRVVIACDTGIWWSPIPPAPAVHGTYNWQRAHPGPGLNPSFLQGHFARLAKGPGWTSAFGGPPTEGTIVAAAWGPMAPGQLIYAAPEQLIYWGNWSNGQLVLNSAHVAQGPGNLFLIVGRTSLAACALDAHTMYAAAENLESNHEGDLVAVWKSSDGGRNWAMLNLPPSGAPPNGTGHQGSYNGAIAVSLADCNTVAIGWQYSSFVSFDGGITYPMPLNGTVSGGHLHDDYHALLFDPLDPQTLWFGTDGGISSASGVVNNGTPTFASYYNEHLFDLQFYHASPSFHAANLVAGPLQDNATVWSVLPNWWTRVPGSAGDGQYTEFAGLGSSSGAGGKPGSTDTLAWYEHQGTATQQSIWDGGFSNPSTIPVADNNNPRDQAGISGGPNWNVRRPTHTNAAGELMYVVMGVNTDVYGLFANSDGSDVHWEKIGSIGSSEYVTAISSFDGHDVFVGTDHGNICQLTLSNGPCVNFMIDQPQGGTIGRINGLLELNPAAAFAATGGAPGCAGCTGPAPPGFVLTFAGQSWEVAGGGLPSDQGFTAVDGPDLGSVFAANQDQVFVTHNQGVTWLTASSGLPAVTQSNELHYVLQPDNTAYMYLSTYGWSMFRLPLQ